MIVMGVLIVSAAFFAGNGIIMHNEVPEREARLHEVQDQYFNTPKAERDSAPRGSKLNAQLVEIQQTPSQLLELKLIGIGRILAGIFILLLAILIALMAMPTRLKMVIENTHHQQKM